MNSGGRLPMHRGLLLFVVVKGRLSGCWIKSSRVESSRVLVVARRGRTGEQRRWLAVSIQLDPCHVSTTETSVLKKSEGWSRKRRMALTDGCEVSSRQCGSGLVSVRPVNVCGKRTQGGRRLQRIGIEGLKLYF